MKHSIRVKFTMIFIGLMAAVLVSMWAVNSFFLEGFYTRQKLQLLENAYEEAKQLLRDHRQSLDRIAAFLIEKETITGKEFMEIFHEVEGIDPDAPKKEEARIGMNPVEGEGFVMKSADDTAEEPVEAIKEVVCEEE